MLHVLLVEDDDAIRDCVRQAMEQAGHRVVEARNGTQGVALALADQFDAVVADVQMPQMSGLTLFRRLRRERPGWPVILMTTFGSIADAVYALKEGAAGYVTKPFDPERFVETMLGPLDRLPRGGGGV